MGVVCLWGFYLITEMDPFYLQSEIEFDGDIVLGNCSPACPLRSRWRWRRSKASPSPPSPPAKRMIPQYLYYCQFSLCAFYRASTLILHWLRSWFEISKVTSYLSLWYRVSRNIIGMSSSRWITQNISRIKVKILHLAFSWHPVAPCEASALQNNLYWTYALKNHMYLTNNLLDFGLSWSGPPPAGLGSGRVSAPPLGTFP